LWLCRHPLEKRAYPGTWKLLWKRNWRREIKKLKRTLTNGFQVGINDGRGIDGKTPKPEKKGGIITTKPFPTVP
jgi:hypothetical protein